MVLSLHCWGPLITINPAQTSIYVQVLSRCSQISS